LSFNGITSENIIAQPLANSNNTFAQWLQNNGNNLLPPANGSEIGSKSTGSFQTRRVFPRGQNQAAS
jgi:hypothetical protein